MRKSIKFWILFFLLLIFGCEQEIPPLSRLSQPVLSLKSGIYPKIQYLTISGDNSDVTFYYTMDGTDPTHDSNIYSNPIKIVNSATIKAISYKEGYLESEVVTGDYEISPSEIKFSPKEGVYNSDVLVTLACDTENSSIYYTLDGTEPSGYSTRYNEPVLIKEYTKIRAVAVRADGVFGSVEESVYNMILSAPVSSLESGTYFSEQNFEFLNNNTGDIYYTLDGSDPDITSFLYKNIPIKITESTKLKAILFKNNWVSSEIAEYDYVLQNTPVKVSIISGTYPEKSVIELSYSIPQSKVYYTTDGKEPDFSSSYTTKNPAYIEINGPITLQAFTYKTGWEKSSLVTETYSVWTGENYAGDGWPGRFDSYRLNAQFEKPFDIVSDKNGNLYISDCYSYQIRKIDSNGLVSTLAGTGSSGQVDGDALSAQLLGPKGMFIDNNSNIFFIDKNMIRKLTVDGKVETLAGTYNPGFANGENLQSSFNTPQHITMDSKGNIYITDSGNYVIRKISTDGMVTTFAGTGQKGSLDGDVNTAQFSTNLKSIVCDDKDNLYVIDSGLVRKIDIYGTVSTVYNFNPDVGLYSPSALTIDSGNNLYVVTLGHNGSRSVYYTDDFIFKLNFKEDGTFSGEVLLGYFGDYYRYYKTVNGICISSNGDFYLADAGENKIKRIFIDKGLQE